MKIDMTQSLLPVVATNTKPSKYKVEVTAIGSRIDAERFYNYISRYELLKQEDLTKEYYK